MGTRPAMTATISLSILFSFPLVMIYCWIIPCQYSTVLEGLFLDLGLQSQGLIAHASPLEELAEEFIKFETHRLDADDHALESDNEQVSQHHHGPVAEPMTRADQGCQDEYHGTQTCMSDRKSGDTHIGDAVAQ